MSKVFVYGTLIIMCVWAGVRKPEVDLCDQPQYKPTCDAAESDNKR